MRLVTWNINSLKARLPRVEEWIAENEPDVLCIQETKMTDAAFPAMTFEALGYETVHAGQGQWNGVAILSRVGIDDVVRGFADGDEEDPEARLLRATCGGVRLANVYVPNGRALDNDHYTYKLGWLERLRLVLDAQEDPSSKLAILGDFNIAPGDDDVWDPAAFVDCTHTSAPERDALRRLEDWGLTDVFLRPLRGGRCAVLLVGLPRRQLPQGNGHADRSGAGHDVAGRARLRRGGRSQRPQGQGAVRPRPGHRGDRPRRLNASRWRP